MRDRDQTIVVFEGERLTRDEAARYVHARAADLEGLIPGELVGTRRFPLDEGELQRLYGTNAELDDEAEWLLTADLPDLPELETASRPLRALAGRDAVGSTFSELEGLLQTYVAPPRHQVRLPEVDEDRLRTTLVEARRIIRERGRITKLSWLIHRQLDRDAFLAVRVDGHRLGSVEDCTIALDELDRRRALRFLREHPGKGPEAVELGPAGRRRVREALDHLARLQRLWQDRRRLLARVQAVAPGWAREVRNREGAHGGGTPPAQLREAWKWRYLKQALEELEQLPVPDDEPSRAPGELASDEDADLHCFCQGRFPPFAEMKSPHHQPGIP